MTITGDRLRIAQVAPLIETVPPRQYGGTERVIYGLTEQLVRLGHDVTLFAAGGSQTSARFVAAAPAPFRQTMTKEALIEIAPHLHLQMLADVYHRADEFDLIHAHTDIWTLPFMRLSSVPTVLTLHGRLDLDVVQRVFPLYPEIPLVSISDSQRGPLDHFPIEWAGTVYNGLPLDAYFDAPARPREYLAFIGRITPEKRPDWAVEIASRAGLPLRVAARSIRWTWSTGSTRSVRCSRSMPPTSSVRSPKRTSRTTSPERTAWCSRWIGPSRSGL
jgi:glycosyltransferase involved in cell wall biosynthesis